MNTVAEQKSCLTISSGAYAGRSFTLGNEPIVIGRDDECEICVPDVQASRRHARIRRQDHGYEIEDLDSRNGVLVNGRGVSHAPLKEGDVILIGETELAVHTPGTPPGQGQTPEIYQDTQTVILDARGLAQRWSAGEDTPSLLRAKANLEILYRVGQTIGFHLEVDRLLSQILETILTEVPRVDRCSIHLFDGSPPRLTCAASRSRVATPAGQPALSQTMAATVIADRRAVLTYDAMKDLRFKDGASIRIQHIRSAICAPLQSRVRVIGVIYADAVNPQHRFAEDNLKLVAAIGQQAAVAIENARLYQQLQQEKAALQESNQALQAAQENLVHSAKMAVVGQMASGIVHDLKNPLAIVQMTHAMACETLDGSSDMPEALHPLHELLGDMSTGITQCTEVIQNILEFARPSPLTRSPVPIPKLVAETVRFLRHKTGEVGVAVETDLPNDIPPVIADAGRIKQVLMNILLNAIQAMDKPEKKLSLQVAPAVGDAGPCICIRVTDNGSGMTPEQQAHIFEPFYTTKEPSVGCGGTGLGLSISARIIESHGGHITVDSEPGQGSTLCIFLPLDAPPENA